MIKLLTGIISLAGFLVVCCSAQCRKQPSPPSANSSVQFEKIGNGNYYFERTNKANWYDAFARCRQMNAELISFETMDEWNSILSYRKSTNDAERYWTSGNDLAKEGSHIWMATGEPITINVWTPPNPDNQNDSENCDEIDNSQHLGLNDANCATKLSYICESNQSGSTSCK